MSTILTVNAGSSSLKTKLYRQTEDHRLEVVYDFTATHLLATPELVINAANGTVLIPEFEIDPNAVIRSILMAYFDWLDGQGVSVDAVSHRIVHGGTAFTAPVILNEDILRELRLLSPLAPLHQPTNLNLVEQIAAVRPGLTQVGCFDTMFHMRNRDPVYSVLALPEDLRDEGVQKYGFHGLSYEYVTSQLMERLGCDTRLKTVTAHLGSGCSLCASVGTEAVTTTMGFSALDGLPMGTRCGNLDPGVVLYLMRQKGWSAAQIEQVLYKESGWKGLSGITGDMKYLLTHTEDPAVQQTLDHFTNAIAYHIAGLASQLGGLDNLVFTGGIGERSDWIRNEVIRKCSWLGLELDEPRNKTHTPGQISTETSAARVFLIPTDEEQVLAYYASHLLTSGDV